MRKVYNENWFLDNEARTNAEVTEFLQRLRGDAEKLKDVKLPG